MSPTGDPDLLIRSRSVLLDALEALRDHRESVVLIGAQAIYLHTGELRVALPAMTKDSDIAIDSRTLASEPLIEEAMRSAGFLPDAERPQPGTWISPSGVPVDLMVPEALSGSAGTRGARVPPHSNQAMRRAVGLEAAVVDRRRMGVKSLEPSDARSYEIWVASPAALIVSKLYKIAERENRPDRLFDKDAHDIYRLLLAEKTPELAAAFRGLSGDPMAGKVTKDALAHLERLFATSATALGSTMAGRAESGVGAPEVVSAQVAALAADLLSALESR